MSEDRYLVLLEFEVEAETYEEASEIVDRACRFDHEDESVWLKIPSIREVTAPPQISTDYTEVRTE